MKHFSNITTSNLTPSHLQPRSDSTSNGHSAENGKSHINIIIIIIIIIIIVGWFGMQHCNMQG
jgi:hypothetical protein